MMRKITIGTILTVCLISAAMLLGGCALEHNQEPWVNSGQKDLLADELERDADVAGSLRDRLASGQRDR